MSNFLSNLATNLTCGGVPYDISYDAPLRHELWRTPPIFIIENQVLIFLPSMISKACKKCTGGGSADHSAGDRRLCSFCLPTTREGACPLSGWLGGVRGGSGL